MADPGELCQTASAIRAEAAGVRLKPLPLRLSAGRSQRRRRRCLSASSEGLNQLVAGKKKKNKASSSSADQNCSAQITLMKYLSSLAGEISILMAHQAQLSQIMKIHLHCQSTAVRQGRAGAGSEQTGLDKNMLLFWAF